MRIAMSTPFLDHVDDPVGRHQLELQQRIAFEELGDHRRELVGREGERGRDLQQPVRRAALAADLVLQRLDLAHDAPRGGVEGLALLGEIDRPRRALEQPHAQPRLQPRHQLADRRRGQAEAGRGGGKAFGINDPDEGRHLACVIDHCAINELYSGVFVNTLRINRQEERN